MITRLHSMDPAALRHTQWDLCIVGAGMAGLTLASQLSRTMRVLLLEAGEDHWTAESQDCYRGKNSGTPYFPLDITRLRFLGGSSNHWAGWCRALDPMDFNKCTAPAPKGWPIGHAELQHYLKSASEILELPSIGENPRSSWKWDALFASLNGFQTAPFRFSPPTRFATRFKSLLDGENNLQCLLGANLTDLELDSTNGRVTTVHASTLGGKAFQFNATKVVLACGGIENARLLLNFNKQFSAGIGNHSDWLGRCFAEHPHFILGAFVLEDHVIQALREARRDAEPLECHRYLSPTPEFMLRENCLNFGLRFEAWAPEKAQTFKGRLKGLLCSSDWSQSLTESLSGSALHCGDGVLKIAAEQLQDRNSRITLGHDRDTLGLARPVLHWKMGRRDKDLFRLAATKFGEQLALNAIGRLRLPEWLVSADPYIPGLPTEELAGHHHMGTTRMSADPVDGVVDPDSRVHGIDNLFVAGSSVFPRTGYANPSLSIVQLALRLADHLS